MRGRAICAPPIVRANIHPVAQRCLSNLRVCTREVMVRNLWLRRAEARGEYRRSRNDIARAVTAALRKREDLGLQVFTKHMGAHDVRVA